MAFEREFDVPGALAALADPWDPERRLSAAAALAQHLAGAISDSRQVMDLLQAHPDLIEGLVRALGDRHKGVQVHTAECLEVLAHFSPEVVPALHRTLHVEDPWHTWGAAIVLARMGIWAPEMGPALASAMGSRNRDVRWAAASLVLKLAERHGQPLVHLAVQAAGDADPVRRKMAAYLLGEMGRRGYLDAAPVLFPLLEDPDRDVRRAAILALDRQPPLSPRVQEKLQYLSGADPDVFVRRTAAGVLGKYAH